MPSLMVKSLQWTMNAINFWSSKCHQKLNQVNGKQMANVYDSKWLCDFNQQMNAIIFDQVNAIINWIKQNGKQMANVIINGIKQMANKWQLQVRQNDSSL